VLSTPISLVLPAYNEQPRIRASLEKIEQYAAGHWPAWELIVVDDGSQDGTAVIVQQYHISGPSGHRIRLLRNDINRGKGFSVRRGFMESGSDIVLFSDADLSTPIEESDKLLRAILLDGYDGAFGSRALPDSLIHLHQPMWREYGGKAFNLMMRGIAGLPYRDTQCGFKAFRKDAFLPVFQRQKIERFGFDVEILYLARKNGLRLQEVPVNWSHCQDSKVRYSRDSSEMFLDLLRIRWNDWRGYYN
jgi:dolichyl-phosphate beta-glucosyltransferase